MNDLPSLRQLQYLVALHQYQHFKKAASSCGVTQSTLSAAIVQLEESLECQLLERSHKSFIFTPLGEEVVIAAKSMVQAATDLQSYTRQFDQPMSGSVVLGCIPTIAPFALGAIGKNTVSKYPNLKLMYKEGTSGGLLKALHDGQLDMAIVALPLKAQGLHVTVLAEDPFNLVIHRDLVERYGEHLGRLPDRSFYFLQEEDCMHQQVKSLVKLPAARKFNSFEATSLQSLVQMVDINEGVTVLPQMAINSQILSGTRLLVRRVEPAKAKRRIAVLWRPSSKRTQTFVELTKIISEVIRSKCVRYQPF